MKIPEMRKGFISKSQTALLAAFLIIVGCSNPVQHIPELTPEQLAARSVKQVPSEQNYKMVPYDKVTVRFTYHPEQDPKTPLSVRPDGQITLDGIGSVQAAGRTPEELGKDIAEKSSNRLRDPQVIVMVTDFAQRKIYVGGSVKSPGIVNFQGEISPIQAIFDRGGFADDAQKDSVVLIRYAGGPEPIIGRINVNQGLEN